jgi:hypothetical protein
VVIFTISFLLELFYYGKRREFSKVLKEGVEEKLSSA